MDVDEEPVAFEPPLYIQRDNKIIEIIENHKQATHVKYLNFQYNQYYSLIS